MPAPNRTGPIKRKNARPQREGRPFRGTARIAGRYGFRSATPFNGPTACREAKNCIGETADQQKKRQSSIKEVIKQRGVRWCNLKTRQKLLADQKQGVPRLGAAMLGFAWTELALTETSRDYRELAFRV